MLREFIHIKTTCQSILKTRIKPIISYKQSPQAKIKKPKLITRRGNLSNTWYTTSACSHYLHKFIFNIILTHTENIIPTQEIDSTKVLDRNKKIEVDPRKFHLTPLFQQLKEKTLAASKVYQVHVMNPTLQIYKYAIHSTETKV